MKIDFKVAHIGFALHDIWDYQLPSTNEGKLFVAQCINLLKRTEEQPKLNIEDIVTVEASMSVILQCFAAVRNSPYGYTNEIADEMKTSLVTQLMALSNENDEAKEALVEIVKMGDDDDRRTSDLINLGISKITA